MSDKKQNNPEQQDTVSSSKPLETNESNLSKANFFEKIKNIFSKNEDGDKFENDHLKNNSVDPTPSMVSVEDQKISSALEKKTGGDMPEEIEEYNLTRGDAPASEEDPEESDTPQEEDSAQDEQQEQDNDALTEEDDEIEDIEDIQELEAAEAGPAAGGPAGEGGSGVPGFIESGQNADVDSVPRDLDIGAPQLAREELFVPPIISQEPAALDDEIPEGRDDEIGAEGEALTFFESSLPQGSIPGNSPLKILGNFLANDDLGDEPVTITDLTALGFPTDKSNDPIWTITTDAGKLTIYVEDFMGFNQGDFCYELMNPEDHPDGMGNNELKEIFSYSFQDVDGDPAGANIIVTIVDDVPTAFNDKLQCVPEGENMITGNVLLNDILGADTPTTLVKIFYDGGMADVPDGGSVEVVTAKGGTLKVFSNGDWKYTSPESVDNSEGNVPDGFTYVIEDDDGDQSQAVQSIEIKDGPGPDPEDDGVDPEGEMFRVFESGLPMGSDTDPNNPNQPPQPKPTMVTGNILENDTFGSDPANSPNPILKVSFDGVDYEAEDFPNGVIVINTTIGTLTVYAQDYDGNLAGDFKYTLNIEADHPDGMGNNILGEIFNYTIGDNDGDTGNADLLIKVVDDVPKAFNDPKKFVKEGENEVNGNVLDNDVTGADKPVHVIKITYNGGVAEIPKGGFVEVETSKGGTLKVYSNGEWTYISPESVDNSNGPVSDSFSYMIEDDDGDQSTAGQYILVKDGPGPDPEDDGVDPEGEMFRVFESGLPMGSDTDPNNPNQPPQPKPTMVTGNILENDTFGSDPANSPNPILKVSFDGVDYEAEDFANGVIVINTTIGTLTVYAQDYDGNLAGDFKYTLNTEADHPDGMGNNILGEIFNYTIGDNDGDTGNADLLIKVVDDVPKAFNDPKQFVKEGENEVNGNVLDNDVTGADKPVHVIKITYNGGVAEIPKGGFVEVETSKGGTLKVYSNGEWTYISPESVDNSNGPVSDSFSYMIEDDDGDQSTAAQYILVKDGPGPDPEDDGVDPKGEMFRVFESGLPMGSDTDPNNPNQPPQPKPTMVTGNILANDDFGTDPANSPNPILKVSFDGVDYEAEDFANGVIVINTTIGTLTVYAQDYDGNSAGDFKYTLNTEADHPDGMGNNILGEIFNYTIGDNDGDTGNADLLIKVVDDVPKAFNDPKKFVKEGENEVNGNVLDNDVTGADKPVHVIKITYNGGVAEIPKGGFVEVETSKGGTLKVYSNGEWTYISPENVDNSNGPVSDSFSYMIEDDDGDQSTAGQYILVKDGPGPDPEDDGVDPEGEMFRVFESGLPMGSDTDPNNPNQPPQPKPTMVTGNILANDDFGTDPANIPNPILKVSFDGVDYEAEDFPNGVIMINTTIGTLTVYAQDYDGNLAGDFKYTLNTEADHPDGMGNNILGEIFNYTIGDNDGDTGNADLLIKVVDDVPKAFNDPKQFVKEGENEVNGNVLDNDVTGADKPVHVIKITYNGGVAEIPKGGFVEVETSKGGTLKVYSNGEWTYISPESVDNSNGPVSDSFSYMIEDDDGDQSTAGQYILVKDGPGPDPEDDGVDPKGEMFRVFESGLPMGSDSDPNNPNQPPQPKPTMVTGNILANDDFGTDPANSPNPILKVSFDGVDYEAEDFANGVIVINTTIGTLTVYAQDYDGNLAGDFKYTLNTEADHPDGMGNNILGEIFNYTIGDNDGDTGNADLLIKVVDDVPKAFNDPKKFVKEGENEVNGNVLDNDVTGADKPVHVIKITYNGGVAEIPKGGFVEVETSKGGTLKVYSNGEWTYISPENVDNSNGPVSDSFSYMIEDDDGDQSTAGQYILVKDNSIPDPKDDGVDPNGEMFRVFESGLPMGSDTDPNNPNQPPQPKPTMVTGNILANDDFGDDLANIPNPIIKVSFDGVDYEAQDFANGVIVINTTIGTLTVYAQDYDGNLAGDFKYTLNSEADHPDGLGKNILGELFNYTVADTDGDTGNANLLIKVVDDVPKAFNDPVKMVQEGEKQTSGNVLANDVTGADKPTDVVKIIYDGGMADVPEGGSVEVQTSKGGTLKVYSNGDWTYVSPESVDNSNGPVQDGFIYIIEDDDGDQSQAKQSIQVKDGPGPDPEDDGVNPKGEMFRVFESGLPMGSDTDPNNPNQPPQPKPTMVTGNILANDDFGTDPANSPNPILKVSFDGVDYEAEDFANGVIVINTTIGTLTVYAQDYDGNSAGDFKYTLNTEADHPDGMGNNILGEIFNYTIGDNDGDTGNADLLIKVVDDVPKAINDPKKFVKEGENEVNGNVLDNDVTGADKPVHVIKITYNGGVAEIPKGGFVEVETSLGGILTVYSNGEWTYISPDSVDNSNGPVSDSFSYMIEDDDGDQSTAGQYILVKDGPGPDPEDDGVDPKGEMFRVFESGLPMGSDTDPNNPNQPPQPKPTMVTGNILANDDFGTDPANSPNPILKVSFDGVDYEAEDFANGVIVINTTIGTLTVYAQDYDGNSAGDFKYTLNTEADHPDGMGNNILGEIFNYTIGDHDGDTGNADLLIKVVDDVPKAINDPKKFVKEGENEVNGNVLDNDVTGADKPVHVIKITYNGGVAEIPKGGFVEVETSLGGILTVYSNGEWTYISPDSVDNSNGPVSDSFSYMIEDDDGDQSTAGQYILVKDGPGPDPEDDGVDPKGEMFRVFESGLPMGSDTDPNNPNQPPQPKPTMVTGNILTNDDFGTDPANSPNPILKVSFDGVDYEAEDFANGVIEINTDIGTLIVYAQDYDGNSAGDFKYTLNTEADHDYGQGNNIFQEMFNYTIADNDGDTGNANLLIKVVDDVPYAIEDCINVEIPPLPSFNLTFTIDISGSMGWKIDGTDKTRLELVIEALTNPGALLDSYKDSSEELRITIVTFSGNDNGNDNDDAWTSMEFNDVEDAKEYIKDLEPQSWTNYRAALNETTEDIVNDANDPDLSEFIDKVYWLSDGMPRPSGNELTAQEEQEWRDLLAANGVDAKILNIAPEDDQNDVNEFLEPLANPSDDPKVIEVEPDLSNLEELLIDTIEPEPAIATGNFLDNDVSGADKPIKVVEIKLTLDSAYEAQEYLNDHPELQGATKDGNMVFIPIPNEAITTPLGAKIIVHPDGSYEYTYTNSSDGNDVDQITYIIEDDDWDRSEATASFKLTPAEVVDPHADCVEVFESGLDHGSNPGVLPTMVMGNILDNDTFQSNVNITDLSISGFNTVKNGNVWTIETNNGILTLQVEDGNGKQKGDFSYILLTNAFHDQPANDELLTEVFNYTIESVNNPNLTGSSVLKVDIQDDVPKAHADCVQIQCLPGSEVIEKTINFEHLANGTIITDQFKNSHGVTIWTNNFDTHKDFGVLFDTNNSHTPDEDLEYQGQWAGGNLKNTELGNVLIIQESSTHPTDNDDDGIIDQAPNDEGSRPAGKHVLTFDNPINSFGFDLVDAQDSEVYHTHIKFVDINGDHISISLTDFVALANNDGIVFGERKANRIGPVSIEDLEYEAGKQLGDVVKVKFTVGGSMGIDNITWTEGGVCEHPEVQGNVLYNDVFGADKPVKVDSFKYINAHGHLTQGLFGVMLMTKEGGEFIMNMDGSFTYQAPNNTSFEDLVYYTIIDSDGDKSSSTLTLKHGEGDETNTIVHYSQSSEPTTQALTQQQSKIVANDDENWVEVNSEVTGNILNNDLYGNQGATITEIQFETDDATAYIEAHDFNGLNVIANQNGTTVHIELPSNGEDVTLNTPLGAQMVINNSGEYTYMMGDHPEDTVESFNYGLRDNASHIMHTAKLDINVLSTQGALLNLMGSTGADVLTTANKNAQAILMQGKDGIDEFVIDVSNQDAPETVYISDLGLGGLNKLTFINVDDTDNDGVTSFEDLVESFSQESENGNVEVKLQNNTTLVLENVGTVHGNDLQALQDHLETITAEVNIM